MASRNAAKSSFFLMYLSHCVEMMWEMMGKKGEKYEKCERNYSFGTYKLTRVVDGKRNYF